jgi:hypothetical protein
MFTDYINKFLKIKQEASGLPKWFKTDDDKRKYIQDYYDREGIWRCDCKYNGVCICI